MKPSEVKGLVGIAGNEYFFTDGRDIYRASKDSVVDTRTGFPQGRWECSVEHWRRYRDTSVFSYVTKTPMGAKLTRGKGHHPMKTLSALKSVRLSDAVLDGVVRAIFSSEIPEPKAGQVVYIDGKKEIVRIVGGYDIFGGFWRVKVEGHDKWVNFKG